METHGLDFIDKVRSFLAPHSESPELTPTRRRPKEKAKRAASQHAEEAIGRDY